MMTGLSAQKMIAAALSVSVTLASAEAFAFRGMARTSIHPMGGNISGGQGLTRPGFNGGGEQHHVPQPGPQPHPPGPNPPNPDPQPHPPGPGPHPPGPPPPPPGYWGGGWYVDPVAAAVSVGVTAAVVGSMVATLPPACATVIVGGVTYEQCGGTWYQPQYVGAQVQYVVVTAPQ